MNVLEAIQRSTEFLSRKGVDSPRLQAELLLAHLLQLPRMQLYLNFERSLDQTQVDSYREMIKRRGQREPLQQITGSTSFCGLEIQVNPHVLVPRPETELLAEHGWEFLRELARANPAEPKTPAGMPALPVLPPRALDYGAGSGCIAMALAAKCPECRVTAVDVSPEALALARRNVEALGLASQVDFLHADRISALDPALRFHLIISNPPYIPSADIEHLQPEVRDHEPRSALDGGPDGLDFYREIAREAPARLLPRGKLMLEFGDGQSEPLQRIFQEQNWIVERLVEDYTRRPRILIATIHGKFTD